MSGLDKEKNAQGIKQQAGELFKAAGGVVDIVSKRTAKKGSELKERLDREELSEKALSGIKKMSPKAAHSTSKFDSKTTDVQEEATKVEKESHEKLDVPDTEDIEVVVLDSPTTAKDESKPMMDAIKDELKERRRENKKIHAAVKAEEERLAKKREAAKKNVVRKIKVIDDLSTKHETQRDEKKLAAFQEKEELKVAAARSERRKNIVAQNKKSIRITAAIIVAIVLAIIGGIIISGKARASEAYNYGVECILEEDYVSAVDVLTDLKYKDSEALLKYAGYQTRIDEYKGRSIDLLNNFKNINDIENEDVKAQYDEVVSQMTIAKGLQDDIDAISLDSVEAVEQVDYNKISNSIAQLSERYKKVVDTEKYDIACKISENLKNDTEVAKLISDISSIGKVSLDSEDTLKGLRKRYDALPAEDQSLIINESKLKSAEAKYNKLKAEKEEEERIKKEEEKQAALKAEAEASAAESRDRITVYVTSTGKYHLDGCGDLNRAAWSKAITYGDAKARGYSPCQHCNPDVFCERTFDSEVNDYIDEHSND